MIDCYDVHLTYNDAVHGEAAIALIRDHLRHTVPLERHDGRATLRSVRTSHRALKIALGHLNPHVVHAAYERTDCERNTTKHTARTIH